MSSHLLTDFIFSNSPPFDDVILELVAMAHKCAVSLELDQTKVNVDYLSLMTALERYTRDTYGFKRIHNLINQRFDSLLVGMKGKQKDTCIELKKELIEYLRDSGIRIPSENPYTQKRAAFLLYHLAMSKPFYIAYRVHNDPKGERMVHFNAYVSIFIVKVALAAYQLAFNSSQHLLRALTFRQLSRSAVEAIMFSSTWPLPQR
jgi:hypothetical protein